MILLVLIAVPPLSIQLREQKRRIWDKGFVEAALILGGGKNHIYVKHILPQLYEEWVLIFGQQLLQVLTLLVHLGVLEILFGGTVIGFGLDSGNEPTSVSHEWSGLIGNNLCFLSVNQWILFFPVLFFTMTALCVSMINSAIIDWFNFKEIRRKNGAA
ncbi:ABC transporter permease subunit [Mesobacillus zeae]|uniref:ABC transporter permease subunit n=1 Tax=Mesobacillus zeae TaxID=1917180 RepID=UPI0015E67C43|nr:ABC transporter permease subunit [Mesobacillus zeae]